MAKSREYRIEGLIGPIQVSHIRSHGLAQAPGILLLHDAFGAKGHIQSVAERLAGEGFEVFLPNLYTRQPEIYGFPEADAVLGHGLTLGPDRQLRFEALSMEDRRRLKPVRDWFDRRDTSGFDGDTLEAARWARMKLNGRPLAAWGFCLGGGLVGELAAEAEAVDAGVIFYGRIPRTYRAEAIRVPLHGHFAESDPNITPHVQGFASILRRNGVEFSHTVHAGTRHGFFNPARPAFQKRAAEAAWSGSLSFLRKKLSAIREPGSERRAFSGHSGHSIQPNLSTPRARSKAAA